MSTKGGSTTSPTVSGSLRSHTSCRRFAPLILPNWTASSRRVGSGATEAARNSPAPFVKPCQPGLHGRYEQGASQRSAVPWRPPCATHALPANGSSEPLFRPSQRSRGAWPPRIARGSPWRAARHQGGIRIPPKIPAVVPSSPCFGSPAALQAVPILPSSSLHSPAEPALCDCSSAAPCTTNRPTSPWVSLRHRFSS